jgi:hypothetical protein
VTLDGRHELRLGRRIRVRVVDISGSGALLAADERLPVGARGRLQILLSGGQFEGQLVVKREQPAPADKTQLIGVSVTPSQPRYLDVLEQFLRRAGN